MRARNARQAEAVWPAERLARWGIRRRRDTNPAPRSSRSRIVGADQEADWYSTEIRSRRRQDALSAHQYTRLPEMRTPKLTRALVVTPHSCRRPPRAVRSPRTKWGVPNVLAQFATCRISMPPLSRRQSKPRLGALTLPTRLTLPYPQQASSATPNSEIWLQLPPLTLDRDALNGGSRLLSKVGICRTTPDRHILKQNFWVWRISVWRSTSKRTPRTGGTNSPGMASRFAKARNRPTSA